MCVDDVVCVIDMLFDMLRVMHIEIRGVCVTRSSLARHAYRSENGKWSILNNTQQFTNVKLVHKHIAHNTPYSHWNMSYYSKNTTEFHV